jgi:hypothetical protein
MKKIFLLLILTLNIITVQAQKVSYKDDQILIDDKPIASIRSMESKGTMGLVNDYEIYNLQNQLLIVAAYDSDYPENKNDNMSYHYKLSFVGLDKDGYFKLSKLGTAKSLAKLVGNGGIIKNDALDNDALFTFIAKNGKAAPAPKVEYVMVERNRSWPLDFREPGAIEQQSKMIGNYRDATPNGSNVDYYEFSLPGGLIVAKVNFKEGNDSQVCEITTMKDNLKRPVSTPSKERNVRVLMGDRNLEVIRRIAKWLVDNNYL